MNTFVKLGLIFTLLTAHGHATPISTEALAETHLQKTLSIQYNEEKIPKLYPVIILSGISSVCGIITLAGLLTLNDKPPAVVNKDLRTTIFFLAGAVISGIISYKKARPISSILTKLEHALQNPSNPIKI